MCAREKTSFLSICIDGPVYFVLRLASRSVQVVPSFQHCTHIRVFIKDRKKKTKPNSTSEDLIDLFEQFFKKDTGAELKVTFKDVALEAETKKGTMSQVSVRFSFIHQKNPIFARVSKVSH